MLTLSTYLEVAAQSNSLCLAGTLDLAVLAVDLYFVPEALLFSAGVVLSFAGDCIVFSIVLAFSAVAPGISHEVVYSALAQNPSTL